LFPEDLLDACSLQDIKDWSTRVVLTGTLDTPVGLWDQSTAMIDWRRDQLMDSDGNRLSSTPPARVRELTYVLTPP
jgi:hypothetical protein